MVKYKLSTRNTIQIIVVAVLAILLSVGVIFAMIMDEKRSNTRKMNKLRDKYLDLLSKKEKEERYAKTLDEAKKELPDIDKIDMNIK